MSRGELLYPQRKRCRACRGYLGFLVVRLLYCSYACAGMPQPPAAPPPDVPRMCVNGWIKGVGPRAWKRGFPTLALAEAFAARHAPDKGAYACSYCGLFHIGRPPR